MRLSLALWGFSLLNGAFADAQQYVISTFAGGGPLPVETSGANLSIDWNSKGLAVDPAGPGRQRRLRILWRRRRCRN